MWSNDTLLSSAETLCSLTLSTLSRAHAVTGATVSTAGINAAIRDDLTERDAAAEESGDLYAPVGISLYARAYPVVTVRNGKLYHIRIVPAKNTNTERLEAFAAKIVRRQSVTGLAWPVEIQGDAFAVANLTEQILYGTGVFEMSGEGMTRCEFLRGGICAMLGAAAISVFDKNFFAPETARAADAETAVDATSLSITRDISKCIGCGKCVEMCSGRQGLDILEIALKNGKAVSALKHRAATLSESACIGCGQCARHCPSGAIKVKDGLSAVNDALNNPNYQYIVWQFAPSAQHIIGEEFRVLTGADMSKKIASAVRELGSRNLAFSTDFGADITIMEEATEFVNCFRQGEKKPFMTSCCPGWVNYVELTAPDIIPHLSSCKSPMEMLGALIKSYLPEKTGVRASGIFHVAVMPCTAKKYERAREEMTTNGVRTVDATLTVIEFKNLLMSKGIDLAALPDGEYDSLFDGTSGAGRIFGATGGVCEAAMRTAYYLMTGQEPPTIEFSDLRGNGAIKTTEIQISGMTVHACVVNGIANIKDIIADIRAGTCPYDFIEVMACLGGCSGGGGTPVLFGDEGVRHRGRYQYDKAAAVPSSHNNRTLSDIYADYLTSPCSTVTETLLHTSYRSRKM